MRGSKNMKNVTEKVVEFYKKYPYPPPDSLSLSEKLRWIKQSDPTDLTGLEVLDAGCGTGIDAAALATEAKRVLAVDVNENSLRLAKNLAKKHKIKNMAFKQANLDSKDYHSTVPETFDSVYSIGVLHHLRDPQLGFSNLVRNVKTGGKLTIGLYDKESNYQYQLLQRLVKLVPTHEARMKVLKAIFPKRHPVILADTYLHPQKTLHTIDDVKQWYKKHGFNIVGMTRVSGFFLITGKKQRQ